MKADTSSDDSSLYSAHRYDPDAYPADIDLAKKHGKASQIGLISQNLEKEMLGQPLCPCCGLEVNNKPIPKCAKPELFNSLGDAYPQLFEFMKWIIFFLLFGFLTFSIATIKQNIEADNCISDDSKTFKQLKKNCPTPNMEPCNKKEKDVLKICQYWQPGITEIEDGCCSNFCDYVLTSCILNLNNLFYYPNKQFDDSARQTQSFYCLGLSVIYLGLFQLMRYKMRQSLKSLDMGLVKASDYAIIIRNLPYGDYTEEELKEFLEMHNAKDIVKIVIGYDILEYSDLCAEKQKLLGEKMKVQQYQEKNKKYPKKYDETIFNRLITDLEKVEEKIKLIESENEDLKPSQTAFAIFQKKEYMLKFLREYETSGLQLILATLFKKNANLLNFKECRLQVNRAPEPSDIVWENCGFKSKEKMKQRIISLGATFLLLSLSFGILVSLSYWQTYTVIKMNDNHSNSILITVISYVFSIAVTITNYVLKIVILKLSKMEKFTVSTYFNISTTWKFSFAQYCNVAFLTFVANLTITSVHELDSQIEDSIQRSGGILDNILSIVIINSIVTSLTPLLDVGLIMKKIKRIKVNKQFLKQSEANQLFEGSPIFMYYIYSYIFLTVWITGSYAPAMPSLFFYAFIGILLYYWTQKIMFCRYYTRPPKLSSEMTQMMMQLLEYFPVFIAVGQLFIDFIYSFPSLLSLLVDLMSVLITGINFLLPGQRINEHFFPLKDDEKEMDYEDARIVFTSDYDLANPITKESAWNDWMALLKQRNYEKYQQELQKSRLLRWKEEAKNMKLAVTTQYNKLKDDTGKFIDEKKNKLKNLFERKKE